MHKKINQFSIIEIVFWSLSLIFLVMIIPAWLFNWPLFFTFPVILVFTYFFLFRIDKVFDFIFFITPFSIQLSEFFPQVSFDIFLPTEPLILALLLVFAYKMITGSGLPRAFVQHPISIALYIYLFWLIFTSITSSMPLVSLKYVLMKIWYIGVFYFYLLNYLHKYKTFITTIRLYVFSFALVIMYSLIRLSGYGFNDFQAAHFVMEPFYRDHTIYGAVLALFIPVLLSLIFRKEQKALHKIGGIYFLLLFLVALIFSYTRAAWISLLAVAALFLLIYFKVSWKWLLSGALLLVIVSTQLWWTIYFRMESNKQDSSSDFSEHVESITNIATDASNLERINRWKAAWRLAAERPGVGWGPGTYQFQYASVQFSYDKTIISTNFGDGGNAHSEYLGHLAETGWPGMFIFIGLIASVLISGIKALTIVDAQHYALLFGVLLGLSTYFVHAFLNNFLDADKMAVPFWSFLAFIVYAQTFLQKNDTVNKN